MSATKCPICGKPFLATQRLVRIVVEAFSRDEGDGLNHEDWSKVHDWEECAVMHLACASDALDEEIPLPYPEEVSRLFLDELVEEIPPPTPLRLVQGGSGS